MCSGGGHENDTSRLPTHARGFTNSPICSWQTMMGGYTGTEYRNGRPNPFGCNFDPTQPNPALQPVKRLPRWSSPALSYQGRATGTVQQNMVSALESSLMSNASNWVGNPPPPPAPPGQPSTLPAGCNGQTSVSWSAASGATHYRLSRSSSASFSSPILAYSGPNTSARIALGTSGFTYLRAQACNSGGCSSYGPQTTVSGYSGCP